LKGDVHLQVILDGLKGRTNGQHPGLPPCKEARRKEYEKNNNSPLRRAGDCALSSDEKKEGISEARRRRSKRKGQALEGSHNANQQGGRN